MRADEVEASWDAAKKSWLLRIRIGEEVIRRHCDAARNADDGVLNRLLRKHYRMKVSTSNRRS